MYVFELEKRSGYCNKTEETEDISVKRPCELDSPHLNMTFHDT